MKTYKDRKPFSVFKQICAAAAVMTIAGCHTPHAPVRSDVLTGKDSTVQRVRISAITEFIMNPIASDEIQIKTLVELLDPFDSLVEVPCVLRFEFYEFRPLSSDPRGKRLVIWPEQNMVDPDTKDEHWKDFLRGYEVYLPLEFVPQQDKKYVLEVTCQVNQQRYSDLFKMQYQP